MINIFKLRERGATLDYIGKQFKSPISGERVRQKLNTKRCAIHNRNYFEFCKYCFSEKDYLTRIRKMSKVELNAEIARLARPGRSGEKILQKKILIKKLKDENNVSLTAIAESLHRDRTTISKLYNGDA